MPTKTKYDSNLILKELENDLIELQVSSIYFHEFDQLKNFIVGQNITYKNIKCFFDSALFDDMLRDPKNLVYL